MRVVQTFFEVTLPVVSPVVIVEVRLGEWLAAVALCWS